MRLDLRVTYNDGSAVDTEATTADQVKWEGNFQRSIVKLDTDLRLTDLCWLAWHSLSRNGKTSNDFDTWLNSVDAVQLTDGEAAPVPLESTAPTSA